MDILQLIQSEADLARRLADRDEMILALSRDLVSYTKQNEALRQENSAMRAKEDPCTTTPNP